MGKVWLIGKKDKVATAFKVNEEDIEGYINALRNQGIEEFEVSTPEYGINSQGRFEIPSNTPESEFGSYAAHQPNYDAFRKIGVLDDYIYQSLSHMGNASHLMSWAFTVLDHTDVPLELREEIRKAVTVIPSLQEKLRAYKK